MSDVMDTVCAARSNAIGRLCTPWADFAYAACRKLVKIHVELVESDAVLPISLFRIIGTAVPPMWIPHGPSRLMERFEALEWYELMCKDRYHGVRIGSCIRDHDTVIDCGAYIGVFTTWCLRKGAKRVVAYEPDPISSECLHRNCEREIRDGRVTLVRRRLWKREVRMKMTDPRSGEDRMPQEYDIDVTGLDESLCRLGVVGVDLIKMDIEGSERYALESAVGVISRDRPTLVLCSYHKRDDPPVIRSIVESARADYTFSRRGLTRSHGHLSPTLTICR